MFIFARMRIVLSHIGKLYGVEPQGVRLKAGSRQNQVTCLENAWMLVESGHILKIGTGNPPEEILNGSTEHAMQGKTLLPGFIDSHTHLVFARSREHEFRMKIQGKSYEEIAAEGGGIHNSALAMQQDSELHILTQSQQRLYNCIETGTVATEIKTGYGLTPEAEFKMLRIINELYNSQPVTIKRTLLGAHALPKTYSNRRADFIQLVKHQLIDPAWEQNLIDYVDVFCETGFFSTQETARILEYAANKGIATKVHANQMGLSGGVQVGVQYGSVSVDHLEHIGSTEIEALKNSTTLPVALPGCSFYLNMPYTPGRLIIDAGLPLVLASDFNPGSSPTGNLLFIWSLGCIKLKLSPEEAFNALTINAAAALGLSEKLGSFTPGKEASFMVFKAGTELAQIPYFIAQSKPESVYIKGNKWLRPQ